MKIQTYESPQHRRMEIDPFNDGDGRLRSLVTVRQDASITDWKWRQAEVSWSSIGTVTPLEADQFAEAIHIAAKTARDWTVERAHRDSRGAPGAVGLEGERHDNRGPTGESTEQFFGRLLGKDKA